MSPLTLSLILSGVLVSAVVVIKIMLLRKLKRLEEQLRPKPMVVSLTLSSADVVEEEDVEQRIRHQ